VAAGEVAGWALLLNQLSGSLYSFGEEGAAITFYSHHDMLINALGGLPDEAPSMYDLVSPVMHVRAGVPPSLIFQGAHDDRVWVEATRAMVRKLEQAGAPVVYVEFPQTDHAFDIILPEFSPATQAAWYDLDRFLALMMGRGHEDTQRDTP
jgi:acetyl esterase/lipase